MNYQYIHLDYLELMAAGDHNTRQQLLQMLITDLESSIPGLRVFWEQQDWQGMQELSHHLKSSFPFVGNERIAEANRQLELELREGGGLSQVDQLLLEIEGLLPKVLEELGEELGKG